MTSESTAKKHIQKLQRAIVEGLEDVKGQDIVVFNTAELSPLFERVIIASGTSNRQTRALANSVRDAVRKAGFDKPRTEGEDNGEWIIIDCGQAVAHVMQPHIRQYYRLEEIWGAKPVRLKAGGAKKGTAPADNDGASGRTAARKAASGAGRGTTGRNKAASRAPAPAAKKAAAPAVKKAAAKKAVAKGTVAKTGGSGAGKAVPASRKKALPKVVVQAPKPARKVARKTSTAVAKPAAKPKKKA